VLRRLHRDTAIATTWPATEIEALAHHRQLSGAKRSRSRMRGCTGPAITGGPWTSSRIGCAAPELGLSILATHFRTRLDRLAHSRPLATVTTAKCITVRRGTPAKTVISYTHVVTYPVFTHPCRSNLIQSGRWR
jgi:hypothetical protein